MQNVCIELTLVKQRDTVMPFLVMTGRGGRMPARQTGGQSWKECASLIKKLTRLYLFPGDREVCQNGQGITLKFSPPLRGSRNLPSHWGGGAQIQFQVS